ncbi:MAG: DUF4430 domain-containing protein [Candidatus Bathyarchaeia archaeon]
MIERTLAFVVAGLLVWSVTATSLMGYYYIQFKTYHDEYEQLTETIQTGLGNLSAALENGLEELSTSTETLFSNLEELSKMVDAISVKTNILINYGNGTLQWHNETLVPFGATLFDATQAIAEVKYTTFPELGAFVTSINGVENNDAEMKSWLWWYWDFTSSEWKLGDVGCDKQILHRGDIMAWCYESYATWPPPPPT